MPEAFPTFKKLLLLIAKSNYDRYSVFLCVVGLIVTATSLAKVSNYFTIESIWILSPFVFFALITLIFQPKTKEVLIAWRMAITLWILLDGLIKIQITYFPRSSTDAIAWLFLPVYAMVIVFVGFGISYSALLLRKKLSSEQPH